MIKKIFFLQVLAFVSSVSAQTVMTIQNEPISTEEFKKIYLKNNPKSTSFSRKDVMEYVDLFVLYKMKLQDAKALRLDTIQAVKDDYTKYTDQLAQNILNDKNYVDNIVKETYEHTKSDLKLAHIMVKCDPNASPKDSLLAYNKMKFIKDKTTSQNFAEMAKENSEDKASAVNGGLLGFITAFMTTSDFENVAYATPVGAVSNVIRTNIGFHILKVIEKRPARGRVKVAHIYTNDQKEEDKKANLAKTQIDEAYKNITSKKMTFE
ncbi:MAG: peptidylprolyl isomerase, partial [Chitinophagales bacterium]